MWKRSLLRKAVAPTVVLCLLTAVAGVVAQAEADERPAQGFVLFGLSRLRDGTEKVRGGTVQLIDGNQRILGGLVALEEGLGGPIAGGVERMKTGIDDRMVPGLDAILAGITGRAVPGMTEMKAGVDDKMVPGLNEALAGIDGQILPGMRQVRHGLSDKVSPGVNALLVGFTRTKATHGEIGIIEGLTLIRHGLYNTAPGSPGVSQGLGLVLHGPDQDGGRSRCVGGRGRADQDPRRSV